MKKPTKSIITSTLLAIAFGAMSVGTTFALFTSEASTTINVGAAEVKLGQTLTIQSVSELGNVAVAADASGVYTNSIGGKTYVDAQNPLLVHFEKWAPGDKAVIKITNNNLSNVTIKTRFRVSHTSTSTPDLWGALTKTYAAVDANNQDIGYKFMDWSPVEPTVSKISDVTVTITFPDHDAGEILFGDANQDNNYQNCNCSIMFTQEAVQGNAQTDGILDKMNAALDAAAATAGRNKTMHDALLDIYAATPSLNLDEALIKTAGYVWNVNTDQFYYGQENVTNEYFKICDEMPLTQTNSIYAASTWNTATVNLTGVGFDAGSASGITAVNYGGAEQARTNTIRTNSAMTTVNVNAPQDTVSHYGTAGSLNINAIAGNSYHEHGKVLFAEIKTGRVALEKGADVEHIHLATSEVQEEAVFNNITISKAETVEMPTLSRDPVTIPAEGRLVVALQEGTEDITAQTELDYVWLTAVGVYEQVTVSESKTEAGTNFASNMGTTALEEEKKVTAQQIANNISATVGENEYTLTATPVIDNNVVTGWSYALKSETVEDITEAVTVAVVEEVTTVSVAGQAKETTAENGMTAEEKTAAKEAVVEVAIDSEIVDTNVDYVARIGDVCYEDIHLAFSELQAGQTLRLLKDLIIQQSDISPVATSGVGTVDAAFGNLSARKTFDGCNHRIEFAEGVEAYLFGHMFGEIKNFKLYNMSKGMVRLSDCDHTNNNPIVFRNIELFGNIEATGNCGGFVTYVSGGSSKISLIDCVTNVDIIGSGVRSDYNAAFIGYFWSNHNEIELIRCINKGDVICGAAAFVGGNPCVYSNAPRVTLVDCENQGKIQRTYTGSDAFAHSILYGATVPSYTVTTIVNGVSYSMEDVADGNVPDTSIGGNKLVIGPVDTTLSLVLNNDGTFSMHGLEGAAKYEVSVGLYVGNVNSGGSNRYFAKETITQAGEQMEYTTNLLNLAFVDSDWVEAHEGAVVSSPEWNSEARIVTYNNSQYYLIPDGYEINGYITPGEMFTLSAFDSNNRLIASVTL